MSKTRTDIFGKIWTLNTSVWYDEQYRSRVATDPPFEDENALHIAYWVANGHRRETVPYVKSLDILRKNILSVSRHLRIHHAPGGEFYDEEYPLDVAYLADHLESLVAQSAVDNENGY